MTPYIDIHSHHASNKDTCVTLLSFVVGRDKKLPDGLFSAGIHPWFLTDMDHQKEMLIQLAKRQECLAIGECGLDKLRGGDMKAQEALFAWHIDLSEVLKKPLIIHCVKAYESLLRLFKTYNPKMPWILHGYQGKPEMTKQLLSKGIYLSYGAAILIEEKKHLKESLQLTALEQLFIETDEWEGDIYQIYKNVAEIKEIEEDHLINSTYKHFRNVFKV